jgi:ribulose-5-phosphate 4-epimerase/fuculose-1-phosphate aldolase
VFGACLFIKRIGGGRVTGITHVHDPVALALHLLAVVLPRLVDAVHSHQYNIPLIDWLYMSSNMRASAHKEAQACVIDGTDRVYNTSPPKNFDLPVYEQATTRHIAAKHTPRPWAIDYGISFCRLMRVC